MVSFTRMPRLLSARCICAAASLILASACTSGGVATTIPPSPDPAGVADILAPAAGVPALPPIPLVEGPLAPRVQYPAAGALIASRDSNFIHGTVGNGRATLTINGHRVPVHPNGAFLAFIPVPSAELAQYELVASLGTDTVRVLHPVRVLPPRPLLGDSGRLVVDSASISPRGLLALPADERVRVSIRAPRTARVWLQGPGGRQRTLVAGAEPPTLVVDGQLRGEREGAIVRAPDAIGAMVPERYLREPFLWATEVPARWLADSLTLLVARDADTLRFALARADTVSAEGLGWAMLGADTTDIAEPDRSIYGRPVPDGTYKWFFLPGTIVRATGALGGSVRVRLDSQLEVWVSRSEVRLFPPGFAPPRRVVPNMRLVPSADWVDVIMPVGERPPFQVQVEGSTLVLTLYGTRANTDIIQFVANDPLVRHITWEQVTSDRAEYTLHLAEPAFGWLALWERGSFVLRVRRPPAVNAARPLQGLTIAVDAGHPPAGATGPTGLYEAVPVLAIARELQRLLEERGATVLMTRTSADTLALAERPIMARRANAHALVSIHLNALPDGVNPFTAQGTGAYWFHPPSVPLAREIQRGMVHWMGLPDLGVYYDNLALVRPTWMPSVLCEGAFIMIPEQEYAVRTEEFQERYARGVADGLERYFRALGEGR